MRFGLVPDSARLARPQAKHLAIGPPPGQEDDIGFLDCLIDENNAYNARIFRAYAYLDEGDLEKLQAGAPIEFMLISPQMAPIGVQVWG